MMDQPVVSLELEDNAGAGPPSSTGPDFPYHIYRVSTKTL